MSQWPAVKAKRLLAALFGIGWKLKRQSGATSEIKVAISSQLDAITFPIGFTWIGLAPS